MADLQKMRSVTARDAEEEAQMTRYGNIYTLCPHLSIYLHYLHTVGYLYMATYSWVRPAQVHISTNIYTRLDIYTIYTGTRRRCWPA